MASFLSARIGATKENKAKNRARYKPRHPQFVIVVMDSPSALSVFLIHGFRNRDLRAFLYGPADKSEQHAQAGKVTRLLGILRAHGLIAKVPKTHRYQLTEKGRTSISALLAARHANVKQLLQAA